MKQSTSVLLIIGIAILLNLVSKQLFVRFDLTENQQYTLSKATKNILRNLEEPVTIKAYFSKNLPENYQKTRRDFNDILVEYANISKGMIDFEFISPNEDQAVEQEAVQNGIQPLLIGVREKDQYSQQKAYMGAVIQVADRKEIIPVIQPGSAMEYDLSTNLKKISIVDKPAIGLIQGHGETAFENLGQVFQGLSILYKAEPLDLSVEASIPDKYRSVALINPTDTILPADLAKLDDYLGRGGRIFIAMNRVTGDFQNSQGTAVSNGLENWLQGKGLNVEPEFAIDAQCEMVSVQQRMGNMTFNRPVPFPYFPKITDFSNIDHPVTSGLEEVSFIFASPISYENTNPEVRFTSLVETSNNSGTVAAPTFFGNVATRQWGQADFQEPKITLGGVLEGNISGTTPSKIVIFSDADFLISSGQRQQKADNINLMVNSIDWLSDDTGLIDLRTKSITSRPIDSELYTDEATGTRNRYKYLNFLLPVVLVIGYGLFRAQMRRNKRIKRMQEQY